MAVPELRHQPTNTLLSNNAASWSGWNVPAHVVFHAPISGGVYRQKTSSGVVKCEVNFAFAPHYPNSTISNYFKILEYARSASNATALFTFRDLEGWTRNVYVVGWPGQGDLDSVTDLQRFWHPYHSHYLIPLTLQIPGYLP